MTSLTDTVIVSDTSPTVFNVQTDNPGRAGDRVAVMEIYTTNADFKDYIDKIEIEIKITVLPCQVLNLVETEDSPAFSPLFPVFELPFSAVVDLPLYEPEPPCGFTNADITYSVTDANAIPDWMVFLEDDRKVEIEAPDDEELLGDTVLVTVEATF